MSRNYIDASVLSPLERAQLKGIKLIGNTQLAKRGFTLLTVRLTFRALLRKGLTAWIDPRLDFCPPGRGDK